MALRIEQWCLNPDDLQHLVTKISLVGDPAMGVNWLALSTPTKKIKLSKENAEEVALLSMMAEEQQFSYKVDVPADRFDELRGQNIIIAPVMIPNKLILQIDASDEPFYGFFNSETIAEAAYAFQKYQPSDNFNINHEQDRIANGVYLAETWLVQDTELDKGYNFGFRMPKGTWMSAVKVDDDSLYNELVTTGLLNGLSIEALVISKAITNN